MADAPDVVIATCAELPDGDEDRAALEDALGRAGLRAEWAVWDDPRVDWSAAPTVLRSTWDYAPRRPAFLAWVSRVPRLFNPAAVVVWNSDKAYLRDLATAGVPVVPTLWSAPGQPVTLPDAAEFVVKPSVGAGSRGAGRFPAARRHSAIAHGRALQEAGRTVMVQPYLAAVDRVGETALIYLDGRYSHAIRKAPMLAAGTVHQVDGHSLFVAEQISARQASPAELGVGAAALGLLRERFGGDLLYARVDLLPSPQGPCVVELEVIEPSLFLGYGEGAADRLAAAIASRI